MKLITFLGQTNIYKIVYITSTRKIYILIKSLLSFQSLIVHFGISISESETNLAKKSKLVLKLRSYRELFVVSQRALLSPFVSIRDPNAE